MSKRLSALPRFHRWLERNQALLGAYSSLTSIVGVPLVLLAGLLAYVQLSEHLRSPSIELLFDSIPVRFAVLNPTNAVVREAQYQISLWNLSVRAAGGSSRDPGNLAIPVTSVDYVRARSTRGPWLIESLARSGVPIPTGHTVFGWATVHCPECPPRDYWLYFHKPSTAWFAVIQERDRPSIISNLKIVLTSGKEFETAIDRVVPTAKRIRITEIRRTGTR